MLLQRLILAVAMTLPLAAGAADFTSRQVTQALFDRKPGQIADYAGRDLSYLDLAGLDFRGGKLAGTNFFGTDFTEAKLAKADLKGAVLDRTVLARADLTEADLEGASLFAVAGNGPGATKLTDAPNFSGANLAKTHIVGWLSGSNFTGAKLDGAKLGEFRPSYLSHQPKVILNYARFTNASLVGADMKRSQFQFAILDGADFSNADLTECDFTKANLSGANFTGAKITGADFYNADLRGAKGLDQAIGLDKALNLDKALLN